MGESIQDRNLVNVVQTYQPLFEELGGTVRNYKRILHWIVNPFKLAAALQMAHHQQYDVTGQKTSVKFEAMSFAEAWLRQFKYWDHSTRKKRYGRMLI